MRIRRIPWLRVIVLASLWLGAGCASTSFTSGIEKDVTDLMKAAQDGNTAIVQALLNRGYDINVKDSRGNTALMHAAAGGHTDTVQTLLNRGANVNAKDSDGFTALIFAAADGHAEIVQALLNKRANVNAKAIHNTTALIMATRNGDMSTVQILLNNGANIDAVDLRGETPLLIAKREGHNQIVNLLKDKVKYEIKRIKTQESERRAAEAARLARIETEKQALLAKAEAEKRELPANLVIDDSQFQDNDSFCYHDKILNAGEKGNVEFVLNNQGKGIGFNVVLDISNDSGEIDTLDFQKKLGDIQPGENKKITIPIKAGIGLRNGQSAFLIQAKEKRGYHSQKVKLAVQTSALIPPKLEIQSVEINDGNIGQGKGNGNGIPENNETIELITYIKNSGQGDALGVDLELDSINSGLGVLKKKADIGIIHPGQTVKGKLVFSIPRTFKAEQLRYKLKVDDVRGADSQSRQFALKFQRLLPVLAADYRIYDGNSANSKGNKNGLVENGETVEIVITPKNTGDLEANRVTVSLEPPRSLSLNKSKASVGTILAHDSGDKKSFILPVPRTFQDEKINLNLTISQADFPSMNQSLQLETKIIRPRLTFTHRVTGNVMQGDTPVLEVVVLNEGELDAHGVGVSVNIDTKGINLPTKQKSWGRLPAGAATDPLRFPFMIMRSADPGQLPIKIDLTQTDFPSVTKSLAFNIQEEGVLEVAVEGRQTPTYSRPVRQRYNTPPSIMIISHLNGQKTFKPDITLVANVADDKKVSRVTVKLNGKLITDNNFRGIKVERSNRLVQRLKLDSGKNQITVVAYDNENQISRETITISYHKEKGEIWAVLIGINNYQIEKLNLNYAVNDVREMKSYLVDDFGVPEDHVTVLLDKEATLGRIKKALGTELKKKAGKEDQVIIYFSGHGAPEQEEDSPDGDGFEKYLLPYNVDPEDLFSTALPMKDISTIFGRIKAERIVFLADTCFSGASGGEIFKAAPISDKFWDRISRGKGRVILSASSAKELSQESSKLEHGVFTYYLLEGLRGKADQDGDGFIDIDEIYRYVSKKVPAATGQQQNPIKKGEVEGQIVLGRVQ